MYSSETFGRIFWVDDDYEFKSCPLNVDGTGDFDCDDYVSEWTDWEGVDYNLLLAIHRCELINKVQYKGSILNREAPVVNTFTEELDVKKYIKETENESNMNTYDEQFYKEIVKDSEFSYGKFNENNYPLHLTQH